MIHWFYKGTFTFDRLKKWKKISWGNPRLSHEYFLRTRRLDWEAGVVAGHLNLSQELQRPVKFHLTLHKSSRIDVMYNVTKVSPIVLFPDQISILSSTLSRTAMKVQVAISICIPRVIINSSLALEPWL